ncbi:hypothetical protein D0863_14745 [Hortaea werneckii]|uniref:FMN hydroxy acid dehydrogenase domain-containing protein n=1 Tax=Hortaea werneckii TaxID=91943 RepID=A0A3M7CGW5_HORWE|nr:hypothetical protein D0863_14745 [Hortaea werneckii]
MDVRPDPVTLTEIEQLAQRHLPRSTYDYYACGADDETVLRRNTLIYSRVHLIPRVLRNVSAVDTTISLFGAQYALPVGIAPSAMQRLASSLGEIDTARAAAKLNVNMTLSSQSTTSLEDVCSKRESNLARTNQKAPPMWFQLYLTQDMDRSIPLIKRAETAGYEALVLTVDTPVLGNRLNERKVPLALPSNLRLANIEPAGTKDKIRKPTFNRALMDARTAQQAQDIMKTEGASMHSSSLTWTSTISALKEATRMKIILKGIMCAADAELAVQHGADAIVVSNHGGRQLDCTASSLEVLPEIAAVIRKRIPLIFDGGVRRGSDVVKALCFGADLVLIGRPVLWGLAFDGQKGVETTLHKLEREISRTMALIGATSVDQLGPGFIRRAEEKALFARL